MILVDTSVWINHLRNSDQNLVRLLNESRVLCHPFVRGELALGHLRQREEILTALGSLPQAIIPFTDEVHHFIEKHTLYGRGIGLIDIHLLVSAQLAGHTRIWTHDKRLKTAATQLNLAVDF